MAFLKVDDLYLFIPTYFSTHLLFFHWSFRKFPHVPSRNYSKFKEFVLVVFLLPFRLQVMIYADLGPASKNTLAEGHIGFFFPLMARAN